MPTDKGGHRFFPLLDPFGPGKLRPLEAERISRRQASSCPAKERSARFEGPGLAVSARRDDTWATRGIGSIELVLRLAATAIPPPSFFGHASTGSYFMCRMRSSVVSSSLPHGPFPPAVRMAVNKPTNTYRIFLFGESAANGDPDPTYGMGRYLEALLRERFPGTDFEVVVRGHHGHRFDTSSCPLRASAPGIRATYGSFTWAITRWWGPLARRRSSAPERRAGSVCGPCSRSRAPGLGSCWMRSGQQLKRPPSARQVMGRHADVHGKPLPT